MNPKHPFHDRCKGDLRLHDPGWRIHRAFYRQIGRHLEPGSVLLISEVEPTLTRVRMAPGDPAWDLRKRAPIIDFKDMIEKSGLRFVKTAALAEHRGVRVSMVISALGSR